MKHKIKKYISSLIVIIVFYFIYIGNIGSVEAGINKITGIEPIEGIKQGSVIEQKFISGSKKLCGIAIQFGTYNRDNLGYVQLELIDEGGRVIASERVSKKNLIDNQYHEWYFPPINSSVNKPYTLRISNQNGGIGNEVTVYKDENISNDGFQLYKDNVIQQGQMNLITYHVKK